MKIAITVQNAEKQNITFQNSPVDPRFGRAAGFLLYDLENGASEFIDNSRNLESSQGAGIQAAKTVINAGARTLITGNVGPKAFSALGAGGVEIYLVSGGTVQEAIEGFKKGKLKKVTGGNVEGHW